MQADDLDIHALLAVGAHAGEVRFAGQRALIVDAIAMGALRRDLVAALGLGGARTVLTRFGYAQGWRAAEAMRGQFTWDGPHAMRDAGGRLSLLVGMLRLEPGTHAARLQRHTWPGNVRELENAMERVAALAQGPQVDPGDLPDDLHAPATIIPDAAHCTLQDLERAAIFAALARHGGQQATAAAELGISPSTLYRRLRSYGHEPA